MKEDCAHCWKNYTGECKPVDVGKCIIEGRHTKWTGKPAHKQCACGGKLLKERTDIVKGSTVYYVWKYCQVCGKRFKVTTETEELKLK